MSTTAAEIRTKLTSLLRQTKGPLTRELLLEPARFGLGKVPARLNPNATTRTVCGYCSTGCGLDVHLKDETAINLTPAKDYPVNQGMACPKGWEALGVLDSSDRATTPLLRDVRGRLQPVDWDRALTTFCERFKDIQQKHGSESVAFLSTGQMPTEEMALLGSLAKFGMGILHGDGNTRQCMATSVVAYKQAFGFDAPPYTYADFEQSDTIVLVGSNLCVAHPIMWQRICQNPHNPKIIVVDPRRTETAMASDLHLPLKPKSDLHLLYAVAHVLIEAGWIDERFISDATVGFEDFREHLRPFTPESVSGETGLEASTIRRFAEMIHEGRRVSFWWTMGVNQSYQGVRTAQAIINLALMTGNIGRPGTGANSITGQANAMGSRLFSNTTNLLGGRDFKSVEHRNQVAKILGVDVARIPDQDSWAYPEIIEGILRGRIKGLWVICTNPAHSWINQNTCHDIFSRLDFLVVQDMYHTTETAGMADLVLPAAGWGEKEGTFINSERRFGLLKKVARAPGQALADFHIFKLIAYYWGCAELFDKWKSPEDVFQSLKELSRGRPCDITGIRDYQMLDRLGGIQWPFPESMAVGCQLAEQDVAASSQPAEQQANDKQECLSPLERRLFEDRRFYHEDGRARFLFEQPHQMPEAPNKRFPFLLLTGRGSAAQWHTQTRTSKSAVLRTLYPKEAYVEIHPADARRLRIRPNEHVMIESQRGRVKAKAFITHSISPGQVFMPLHYQHVNKLTHAHFDPYSRQPSYKDCAVLLRPVESWDVEGA